MQIFPVWPLTAAWSKQSREAPRQRQHLFHSHSCAQCVVQLGAASLVRRWTFSFSIFLTSCITFLLVADVRSDMCTHHLTGLKETVLQTLRLRGTKVY